MKTMWFIRGVSGAGKSHVSEVMAQFFPNGQKFEADQFRYVDGVYTHDHKKNPEVHFKCRQAVKDAIESGVDNIIVANTSCRAADVKRYKSIADEAGYKFISLVVENYHETGDVHNVPSEAKQVMASQLSKSIKLV